ncbi:hypothetical protein IJS77_03815 [bacterium]|nr:hypothetical protein [bacterium]
MNFSPIKKIVQRDFSKITSAISHSQACGKIIGDLGSVKTSAISILKKDLFQSENYVEPAKKQFNSLRELLRYSRARVTDALKGKNPYEHLVIIDPKTKKVLGEYKGDGKSVYEGFKASLNTPKNAIIIHGHPTQILKNGQTITTPVSFSDAISIADRGKVIYAFNEQGQFSFLRKKIDFKPLTKKQIKHYENLYDRFMSRRYARRLIKEKGRWFCIKKLFSLLTKKGREQFKAETRTITEDVCRDVHAFWKKYANEMGFVYRTNYSYLK